MDRIRIAIIGSGPAGFYTAEHLLNQNNYAVSIDMFDRLPTPFGLIRHGIAPDHQRTKRVTEYYHQIARNPLFRFFGNVEFGRDIHRNDLLQRYHQIVYATGASDERRLDIPGEDLSGVYSAREVVGWYNAHPDFSKLRFNFSNLKVVIVGNGNVALDIARMLVLSQVQLGKTDMALHALEPMYRRQIREIHILGRKDLLRASFSSSVIEGFIRLPDVAFDFFPENMADDLSLSGEITSEQKKLLNIFRSMRYEKKQKGRKKIVFHFLVSPVAVMGHTHVEGVRLRHYSISWNANGTTIEDTGRESALNAGLLIRSVGYRGTSFPGLPFDDDKGIIPNKEGRIGTTTDGSILTGEYTSGWIKRGPFGSLPHIKKDASETALSMIADIQSGAVNVPAANDNRPTADWLYALKKDFTLYEDWMRIDAVERKRGSESLRPRVKFSTIPDMLNILSD